MTGRPVRSGHRGPGPPTGGVHRKLQQVLELELLAGPDVEPREEVWRQGRQEPGHSRECRTIVPAFDVAADEEPDRSRHDHHRRSSTRRSRKWVAHEMHGS